MFYSLSVTVTIYPHDKFVMTVIQACYPCLPKKENQTKTKQTPDLVRLFLLIEFRELTRVEIVLEPGML